MSISASVLQSMAQLALIVLCSALVVGLPGCGPTHDGDIIAESFGFIADCKEADWERCRRKNQSVKRDSVAIYEELLTKSLHEAREFSASKDSVPASSFEIFVGRDAPSAFVFQSTALRRGGREVLRIETTGETMSTIAKMTIAARLLEVPRFTEAWMPRYLLYIRKTPEGEPIMDPLRASGLLVSNGADLRVAADFTEALRAGLEDAYSVMAFLTAHELFHLDHPFKCVGEKEICLERRRQHEADADGFAVYVLGMRGLREEAADHYLGVPIAVFSQMMLTMEGGRRSVFPDTHPPDHERLRSAVRAIDAWIHDHPEKTGGSLRLMVDQSLKVLADIERETAVAYFAGLDQGSAEVTLESLRLY